MVQQVDDYVMRLALQIQGDRQLTNLAKRLSDAEKTTGPLQKRITSVSKSTKNFGNIAQNVGFQVQDLAVQLQGGVDPARALAQQLPQMTVGFGAVGAAIGALIALSPALISVFTDSAEGAEDLNAQLDSLGKQMDAIGSTVDAVDMSAWVRNFNTLDQSARNIAKALLDVRIQLVEIDFEAAMEDFTSFANNLSQNTRIMEAQLQSMANNMGIAVGNLEELIEIVQGAGGNLLGDPAALERVVELLGEGGAQAAPFLERLQRLYQLQQDIETVQGTQDQAGGAIAANADIATGKLEELEVTLERVNNSYNDLLGFSTQAFAAQEAQIQDQIGLDAIEEFITPLEEDLPEAFSLAAESAEIFGRTFETALNGVAMGTQDLSDAVTNMVKVIIVELGKLAAYQAIASLFPGTSFGNAAAGLLNAKGNAFSGGDVVPFAKGGVVNRPTVFPFSRGVGLMGEKGAEAILPLGRNSRGELGVKSEGMNVIVNNNAPGVAVNPRPSDDGLTIDIVMAQVSAAIDRGGNPISNSIERNYNVGRGRGVY